MEEYKFGLNEKAISGNKYVTLNDGRRFMKQSYADFVKNIEETMIRDLGEAQIRKFIEINEQHNAFEVTIKVNFANKHEENWGQPCVNTPDIDNVAKGLFDSVLGRLGIRDEMIYHADLSKCWAKENRIEFDIKAHQIKPKMTDKIKSNQKSKRRRQRKAKEQEQNADSFFKEMQKLLED